MPRRMARSSSITRITRSVTARRIAQPAGRRLDQDRKRYVAVTLEGSATPYRSAVRKETDMRTRIAIVSLLLAALPCLAATPEEMEALLAQGVSGEALDRVCGVRDCADIRLFWHTDLEAAKKQARAENKPILSLRLLGRLDEEFSCANSRYFRTVYYKNREINDLLRERFVLHWKSVRPVPKVTI